MIFRFFNGFNFEATPIRRNLRRESLLSFTVKSANMTVNIQSVHFDADTKLLDHVNRKIAKIGSHHDKIMNVDVFLKLDNVIHQIKDKVAEIRVQIPKHEIFVKQSTKSFEESFDMALDAVLIQIKKVKEKQAV
jgi:putative sigma-54 modulation protein